MAQQLYFVALLLPPNLTAIAHGWQQYCAAEFNSRGALHSPPHITLQPPFKIPTDEKEQVTHFLQQFASNSPAIAITLDGFNCFEPRVVYIDVQHSPELFNLQQQLKFGFSETFQINDQRYGDRPFKPHVTIAFKDLTKPNFEHAWAEFQHKKIHHEFWVNELTLLAYRDQSWQIEQQFSLQGDHLDESQINP